MSILKILIGMRVYHQISHASSMLLNSKRTQVTLLFQVDLEQMKLRFSMQTTCSNHVLKSEASVELASQSISVTLETSLLVVEEMVSSEYSTSLMK